MFVLTYREVVDKAEHILALVGPLKPVYLRDPNPPYDKATGFSTGGMHRNGIAVSGWFEADVGNIPVRWSFDLEDREANGKSGMHPNTAEIRKVISRLQGPALEQFREWLTVTADAMRSQASETQAWCDQQFTTARVLSDLASQTPNKN